MGGNCLTPTGIAGQKDVSTNVPFLATNVELHSNILHKITFLFWFSFCDFIIHIFKKQVR
jgi:hypothetical protein